MAENKDLLKEAVIENSKWLDKVLMTGFLSTVSIVILKLIGKDSFKFQDIEFNLSQFWIVVLLLTIAHLYTAILMISSIRKLWIECSFEDRKYVFTKIVTTGGIYTRGLIARSTYDGRLQMEYKDMSAWVALLSAILICLSITPFHPISIFWLCIGVLCVKINWTIGTNWAFALSDLFYDDDSEYFQLLSSTRGVIVRSLSRGSCAGVISQRIPYYIFPLWLIINSYLMVINSVIELIFFLIQKTILIFSKSRNS